MSSEIILSRQAYLSNLKFIKSLLVNDKTVFNAVIKGNAYGHGMEELGRIALSCDVSSFSVFEASEARYFVEKLGRPKQLIIMGFLNYDDIVWAIQKGIEFYVFTFERLKIVLDVAKQLKKKAKIHIELETGMHRTGFEEEDWEQVITVLNAEKKHIEIEGLCTHFAGAESLTNYLRLKKQRKKFENGIRLFKSSELDIKMVHGCCSAATLRYTDMQLDMVRIGILQYGFWPSPEIFIQYSGEHGVYEDPLRRVLQWNSEIMSIKTVRRGEYIGYGSTYLAHRDMRIAIIPIGYSHGFSRGLSNTGRVLINGERAGVIGMVNMNSLAANVTSIPTAKIKDEVVLIGHQGEMSISVASFSELSEQINYEMLTRLPEDIPRRIAE